MQWLDLTGQKLNKERVFLRKYSGSINSTTQISEGLTEGLGIDIKSLVAGIIGGKMGSSGIKEQLTTNNIIKEEPTIKEQSKPSGDFQI